MKKIIHNKNQLHLINVFITVAKNGSFTRAAIELDMPISSVSKAVNQLEKVLSVQLINRTTRHLKLTDAGEDYFKSAQIILNDLKILEERIANQTTVPSGILRMTAPSALGHNIICPFLHVFKEQYPLIQVELTFNENLIDMVGNGIDLSLRSIPPQSDSSLYCKRLGSHKRYLVASAAFLDKHAHPQSPQVLNDYKLINYSGPQAPSLWTFKNSQHEISVSPQADIVTNSYMAIYQCVMAGLGIANLYEYLVEKDIQDGKLIRVLPQYEQSARNIFGVYQQSRNNSPKVDAMLTFLTKMLNPQFSA